MRRIDHDPNERARLGARVTPTVHRAALYEDIAWTQQLRPAFKPQFKLSGHHDDEVQRRRGVHRVLKPRRPRDEPTDNAAPWCAVCRSPACGRVGRFLERCWKQGNHPEVVPFSVVGPPARRRRYVAQVDDAGAAGCIHSGYVPSTERGWQRRTA